MTDIKTLMENTGAHRGFIGAEYVDRLGHLTLIEATSQLPCIVAESQIGFTTGARSIRAGLNESTIQVIQESALGTLRDKIEAFFQRMLKWIRSIIAKLKVQIDRIKLSGAELFEKYADKLGKDADYRELTYEGYRFAQGSKTIFALKDNFDANIEDLVKSGLQKAGITKVTLPHEFGIILRGLARKVPVGDTLPDDKVEAIRNEIDDITDMSRDERVAAMASVLAGRTMSENWEDDIRDAAWGEKGPIRYGTDMFSPQVIGQVLKDKYLSECLEGYRRLEKSIQDYRSRLKGELANLWDEFYQTTDSNNLPGNLGAQSLINRYYSVYISCVTDALGAATRLKALKVSFYTDMHRQAVSMLVRLVNKGAGPVNDNYTGEEDEWA